MAKQLGQNLPEYASVSLCRDDEEAEWRNQVDEEFLRGKLEDYRRRLRDNGLGLEALLQQRMQLSTSHADGYQGVRLNIEIDSHQGTIDILNRRIAMLDHLLRHGILTHTDIVNPEGIGMEAGELEAAAFKLIVSYVAGQRADQRLVPPPEPSEGVDIEVSLFTYPPDSEIVVVRSITV